jgi:predicted DNA-binding transcriptional regulator YafY
MARNEQFIRQHRILQILERVRFGRTIKELNLDLQEELGLDSLHDRTIRRDLEALQAAGIDLASFDEPRGKVWKLGPRAKESVKILATASELIALSLGRDLMYPLAGTPFWNAIESFWSKIKDELPASVWQHYEKFRRVVHVLGMPSKSYQAQHGILQSINRAVIQHRIVEIEYQGTANAEPKLRKIEPYGLVFFNHSLYIVAAAHEDPTENRIRNWKLDRFRKAEVQDEWFKPPEDFDLEEFTSRGLGIFAGTETREFVVRIQAKAVNWLSEDPWHHQQVMEKQPDGTALLRVPGVNDLEILPKVLQLGVLAELISPPEARLRMAQIAAELNRRYADTAVADHPPATQRSPG